LKNGILQPNFADKLGEGGFGVVFSGLIRKGDTTWTAAFKRVVTEDHRFGREVANLSQLDNAFVIDFYKHCIIDDKEYVFITHFKTLNLTLSHCFLLTDGW
jgi:Protein tyrosine and serine/threonine kinase